MTVEEIKNRIAKKEQEIAKTEKLLEKYLSESSVEEKLVITKFFETGDYSVHRGLGYSDAWGKAVALYDANKTLEKYQRQLAAQEAKEATLNDMPEVLKEFRDNLINRWNRFDEWKKQEIRKEYNSFDYNTSEERRKFYSDMNHKWGRGWYEFMHLTSEQIHNSNVKDAETLVMNLLERTAEITGKITNCDSLYLDQDNAGYSIINGVVIGEKGKARVESIGAGGYNIQRYHIRVLVKEVH